MGSGAAMGSGEGPGTTGGSTSPAPLRDGGPEVAAPRLPEPVRSRATSWVTATPYRLPLAVALVGLVVSAPFGGWRTAAPDGVPSIAPESSVAAAPFELTLERAYHSPRPSESFAELEEGQQYVVVLGTLTSRHEETVYASLFTGAVHLEGLDDVLDEFGNEPPEGTEVEPALYSAADSRALRRLGPDLAYDIGLVYVTESSELPEELTLQIDGHTWRANSLDQFEEWLDPEAVARVTVPLAEQQPAGADS